MADELANINGVKPNKLLADGETLEAHSESKKSSSVYTIKRTEDHYHCTCMAWRNQKGVPTDARTCKHLRAALGDAYEDARLELKNPGGAGAGAGKAKPKTKPAAKAKAAAKAKPAPRSRKRAADDDDDGGDEEDAEEEKPAPTKKPRTAASKPAMRAAASKSASKAKPAAKGKAKAPPPPDEDEDDAMDEDVVERTDPVAADAEDEDDDMELVPTKKAVNKAHAMKQSKTKAAAEDTDIALAPVAAEADESLRGAEEDDESLRGAEEDQESAPVMFAPAAASGVDELAEINGVKPNVSMADGDEREVGSMTSNSKYKIKRTWDHYYCTCPAWRNQSRMPTNARSCKHLRALLGDAYEDARLKLKNPDGDTFGQNSRAKPASKAKGKGKTAASPRNKKAAGGDDDDEDDDEDAPKKKVPELLLANKWDLDDGPDPTGWWMSEKLDGVRTYWDGKQMLSRLGNPFTPPDWFLEKLPKDITLDGELFGGRGNFQDTVSIVKTVNSPHWQNITFQIFDVPSMGDQPFEERIAHARKLFGKGGQYASMNRIKVLDQEVVKDRQHVIDKLKEVETLEGEGVMLRKPKSLYEGRRSSTLLKVKTFYDAEAKVTGYEPGKGMNTGVTGALKCEMESGKTFKVGTGLSQAQRRKPPKVGAIIVYRFQELTRDGVPRFPSYVGEAADKTEPKDAEVPPHRKTSAKQAD